MSKQCAQATCIDPFNSAWSQNKADWKISCDKIKNESSHFDIKMRNIQCKFASVRKWFREIGILNKPK